ncbi:hypothetical protein CBM2623_A10117 [Cupriavidus taiwanensis]|nr:hypothetical protein CBM2623_A10117 [Cupriavidus taiwanensis]
MNLASWLRSHMTSKLFIKTESNFLPMDTKEWLELSQVLV